MWSERKKTHYANNMTSDVFRGGRGDHDLGWHNFEERLIFVKIFFVSLKHENQPLPQALAGSNLLIGK